MPKIKGKERENKKSILESEVFVFEVSNSRAVCLRTSLPIQGGEGLEVQYQASSCLLSMFVLTIDFGFRMLQNVEHLLNDGLQCPAQLLCTVRLPQWRHMNKSRPPAALV